MLSLTNVLKLNAISSGATGLILVAVPKTLAPVMGVAVTLPIILVGAFLIAFAVFVFEVSVIRPVRMKAVKAVIALDTAWVVGSAIALVFLMPILSFVGNALVIAVALWVAGMVYLQTKGLQQEVQNQKIS